MYLEDEKAYKYVGNCDTLDTEEIDADDKEEYVICGMINILDRRIYAFTVFD